MTKHTVYGITDPKDGKIIYVGYTRDFKSRKYAHRYALRKGKHDNPQLQNLYNSRAMDVACFVVLYEGSENTAKAAEVGHIHAHRFAVGARLCNSCDMGEFRPSIAAARVSQASKRREKKNKDAWDAVHQAMLNVVVVCKVMSNYHALQGKTTGEKLMRAIMGTPQTTPYPEVDHIRIGNLRHIKNPKAIVYL